VRVLADSAVEGDLDAIHRTMCSLRNLALGHGPDAPAGGAPDDAASWAGRVAERRALVALLDDLLASGEAEDGGCACRDRAVEVAERATAALVERSRPLSDLRDSARPVAPR
jgi:hypothetical protein